MSEYQYYEFQAIDRPLTADEMRDLRQLSTRARITPTSFVNIYNYGDFRGNPSELMNRYFDLHLYLANWGTRILMIRVPASLLDVKTAAAYAPDEPVTARAHDGHTIVELMFNDENFFGDWEDGEGWLERLRPVRDELMNGDLRALYLGWLLLAMYHDYDVDSEDSYLDSDEEDSDPRGEIEPPVPPGLGQLSPALEALVDFLYIDRDLLAVAAERSGPLQASATDEDDMRAWVARLPEKTKDVLLTQAIGGGAHLGAELLRMYRESVAAGRTAVAAPPEQEQRRTVGELTARRRVIADSRKQAEAERAAREHAARMEDIVRRAEDLWREADRLAGEKNRKSYESAIQHVTELHAAATHFGTLDGFDSRRADLRARHSSKSSFTSMLDAVGTPKPPGVLAGWNRNLS